MKKSDRSAHIHNCVRREKALDLKISESALKFCYECMEWFQSSQWRDHCSFHIQSWRTQHCEVIVYRNTVIRPGYCPFCLWDKDLEAEDRLHQWMKSGNLKQHIEEKHMSENQGPGAEPICGCGQAFADERDLRHHLHDTHKLNKAIWSNPKLPRKRKRPCKAEAQDSSMERDEQLPKKLRFYRYPPPRLEHEYGLPENIFTAVTTLNSFVEEHPEQCIYSRFSDNPTQSSKSSSVVSCFSHSNPLCSSDPTTPRLEDLIDPRILDPSMVGQNQGSQPWDQAFMQTNSLHDHDIRKELSGDAINPQSPRQSLAINLNVVSEISGPRIFDDSDLWEEEDVRLRQTCEQDTMRLDLLNYTPRELGNKPIQSLYSPSSFVASEANKKEALPRNSVTFRSDKDGCLPTSQDKLMPHGEDRAKSLRGPLTRARARQELTRDCPGNSDKGKSWKNLNAKEKRKLRDFKSRRMTLRQVGPLFPDIDTVFLRKAWADLRLSDRCTRSRVK